MTTILTQARALGVGSEVRSEWDSYDLAMKSGLRIEVKSSAYLQSWAQRIESSISFDIRETVAWDADTNTFAPESARRRQADVYVFALLAHREKASLNPLDVSQWKFYLRESVVLNQHVKKQRRARVVESLASANLPGASPAELKELLRRITARWFLVRDSHSKEANLLLKPRWAMSYLRGPMTQRELRRALGRETLPKVAAGQRG